MAKSRKARGAEFARVAATLKKLLTRRTFRHAMGVSGTAVKLAEKFGEDTEKAALAGLLHDCAKDVSTEHMPDAIREYGVRISRHDRKIPAIWHGLLGAKVAEKDFGIRDAGILNAVRMHSTGGAKMGRLEKIIYVADFIEPGREYRESKRLRKLADTGITLDYLVLCVLREKVNYLKKNTMLVHPATEELLKQIKNNHSVDQLGKS